MFHIFFFLHILTIKIKWSLNVQNNQQRHLVCKGTLSLLFTGVTEHSISSVCRAEVRYTVHGHHLVLHGFQVSSSSHVQVWIHSVDLSLKKPLKSFKLRSACFHRSIIFCIYSLSQLLWAVSLVPRHDQTPSVWGVPVQGQGKVNKDLSNSLTCLTLELIRFCYAGINGWLQVQTSSHLDDKKTLCRLCVCGSGSVRLCI